MRQKKQKLYLYFMLLSAFLFSSCGTNNVTDVDLTPSSIVSTEYSTPVEVDHPTLSPKPDWLVRWLNEPVCQPPCWEKITPGKTSFTDAQAIANTLSGIRVSYVGHEDIRLESNQYDAYNFAFLLSQGDVNIQVISLTTSYTSLELSEIVDRYGFPNEMINSDFFDNSAIRSIDLLYYDLGMVITIKRLPGDPWNKVNLSPDSSIQGISFYAPQLKYYFNSSQWAGMVVSPPIKLNGYGDYDIPEVTCYC